ncbi:MAG TPA: adenylate kinase [Nitrososphaeraceae archaeon]|nr:adenylate kinase [Nitrososphaeraceae archaeon]
MVERIKRIIVVGIPGVGKTTVVSEVKKALEQLGIKTTLAEFGKIMLEEAKRVNIKNRDEIRRLQIEDQKNLQRLAATRISEIISEIVIIDTHLFITTFEGYYPGLPLHLLNLLKPSNLVLIIAKPEEIYHRRQNDSSRDRDIISIESIQNEIDVSKMLISSCSVISGAPFKIVHNNENHLEHCTKKLLNLIISNSSE